MRSRFNSGEAFLLVYRAVLWLYPASFRRRYGRRMLEDMKELIDAERAAGRSIVRCLGRAAIDVVRSLPREWHSVIMDESRGIELVPWLDALGQDVRFGLRVLRREAVVTGAAVASLSLALGACVAAFSLVDALILRPLPVREPERLIYLERDESTTFDYPAFEHLRQAARAQVDLFGMSTQLVQSARFDAGADEPVRAQFVSGNAFGVLGVTAAAGRLLAAHDDVEPGAHPVAVVSHAFWMRRFGGDPSVVGRSFQLKWATLPRPLQLQIVGVVEQGFTGVEPGRPTDVWLPNMMYNAEALDKPWWSWFRIFGRLEEQVAGEQAEGVLQAAFTNFRRELAAREPGAGRDEAREEVARFINTPLHVRSAVNGTSPLRQQFERPLWILTAVVGLVLLIAGSNVANLLLARMTAREREMSLRLSIGAGRARLVRQVLVEGALLAAAACALGLLFAWITGPVIVGMLASPEDPAQLDLPVNGRLLIFAAALAGAMTLMFSLAPALRASNAAPMTAIKAGGARASARLGLTRPLVAVQVGFSLVVLFVGGLLVLSFGKLSNVDPGFTASGVLLLSVEVPADLEGRPRQAAMLEVLDRVRDLPGVDGASSAAYNVIGRAWTHNVRLPGSERDAIEVTMAPVAPGFFETMRIAVLDGRGFVPRDLEIEDAIPFVVNETFARRYFGRERAVGRLIEGRFAMDDDRLAQHEVVGVVSDTKHDLREPAAPTIYIPIPTRMLGTLHVRTTDDSPALLSRLRDAVHATDPRLRVTSVTPQSAVIARTLLRERLLALLSGFFAIVGLVLATVGLYGVLSYAVVQRTKEIGIRLALGARRLPVLRSIVADVGLTMLIGTVGGLLGGLYLARFARTFLFEVEPFDLWSLALPVGVLLAAGGIAALRPAQRVVRVDPVVALRHE